MKIGLSFSRCIRDLVDGNVAINDVLVLITRTDFDPHDDVQWQGIWHGYGGGQSFGHHLSNPEWMNYPAEYEDKFRNISKLLWDQGKIHQPRKFGSFPARLPYVWLEAVLPSSELENNLVAKDAWEQFLVIAGLTDVTLNESIG